MIEALNNKDKKQLLNYLKEQFDFNKKLDYNFFITQKNRIHIFNKNIEIDFSKIRINLLGVYFANIDSETRLTIEGSQIIGPCAKKNILEIDDQKLNEWMHGNDIKTNKEFKGFVLIKNNNDFYGSGKYKEGKIINYIPKERRLKN